MRTCPPSCQSLILSAFLNHSPSFILRESLLLNLEFVNLVAHTDQKAPGVVLSPPPRTVGKLHPPCPPFHMGAEKKTGSYVAQDVPKVIKLTRMVLNF